MEPINQGLERERKVVASAYDLLGMHLLAEDIRKETSSMLLKAYAFAYTAIRDGILAALTRRQLAKDGE